MSPKSNSPHWHTLSVKRVEALLEVSAEGLSTAHVLKRRARYGLNQCEVRSSWHWLERLIAQFMTPFTLVLVVAVAVSAVAGDLLEGWIVAAIIVVNGLIGFFQEARAEKTAQTLKRLIPAEVTTLRDNKWQKVATFELVIGDRIRLEDGMRVPADARIVASHELLVDESLLTGEAEAIHKNTLELASRVTLAERTNMIFAGTVIRSGAGEALVVAVGCASKLGEITTTLASIQREESPLTAQVRQIARVIMLSIALIVAGVGLISLVQGRPVVDTLVLVAALAVAAIPEGLPALLTVTLIHGVRVMSRRGVLVRRLISVETAGTITHIALDKTGTLTENAMLATRIFLPTQVFTVTGEGYVPKGDFFEGKKKVTPHSNRALKTLFRTIHCIPHVGIEEQNGTHLPLGDPTEAALYVLARKGGSQHRCRVVDHLPFNPKRAFAATIVEFEGGARELNLRGAPERILNRSPYVMRGTRTQRFSLKARRQLLEEIRAHAPGLRLIALARRSTNNSRILPAQINDLIFVGIVAIEDSIRPGVVQVLKQAQRAGVKTLMLTGDDPTTARSIAERVGILGSADKVISLVDNPHLTKEEILQGTVFARVDPKTKLLIVKTLQENGAVIAMTGDGSNDAPALARADVGIALGRNGTDTAREAADIILTSDRFDQIVAAIEEGRTVFRNVRRTVLFQIGTNLAEVAIIVAVLLGGGPTPLLPLHILWVNVISDGIAGSALAFESKHRDVLQYPPLPKAAPLLSRVLILRLGLIALSVTLVTLIAFWWGSTHAGLAYARTLAFFTLILTQLVVVWESKSLKYSLIGASIRDNMTLVYLTLLGLLSALLPILIPPLRILFHFTPLDFGGYALAGIAGGLILAMIEADKYIRAREHVRY